MIFPGYNPNSDFKYVRFASGGIKTQNPREFGDAYTLPTLHPGIIADCYAGIFLFKKELLDYHIEKGRDKGFRGEHDALFIPIDIDSKNVNDLPSIHEQTKLFLGFLEEEYGLPSSQLSIFFSGNRGFHILFPTCLLEYKASPALNVHIKNFVLALTKDHLKIDNSIYDQTHMLRLPNSRHSSSNLLKVQLNENKIYELSISEIRELAEEKTTLIPPNVDPDKKNEKLQAIWNSCIPTKRPVGRPSKSIVQPPITRNWLCIDKILQGVSQSEPSRDACGLRLACHFKIIGYSKEDSLKDLLQWNSQNTPPLEGEQLEKINESAFNSQYEFKCVKESQTPDQILQYFCQPEECEKVKPLKELIDNIRFYVDADGFKRECKINNDLITKIGQIAFDYFLHRGQFVTYQDKSYLLYNGKNISIPSNRLEYLVLSEAGLISTEHEGRGVLKALELHASHHARKVEQFGILYVDSNNATIYINTQDRENSILQISPNSIEHVPNGFNGILLTQSYQTKPWTFIDDADIDKAFQLLLDLIWNNIACDPPSRSLTLSYILCAFIREYSHVHPILKASGPKESGKSMSQRLISYLIYGVDELSNTTAAAAYSEGHNLLLFFDNLESPASDIENMLTTTSTGVHRKKRKHGSDSDTIAEKIDALICVNSISSFPIPELVQRTIEINFHQKYHNMNFLFNPTRDSIVQNRSYILSGIMKFLSNNVLPDINQTIIKYKTLIENEFPKHEKQRLNDFLAMMYPFFDKICRLLHKDTSSEWNTALTSIIEAEKVTQKETNDCITLLDQVVLEWEIKNSMISSNNQTVFFNEYGFEPEYPHRNYKDDNLFVLSDRISFKMNVSMQQLFMCFARLSKLYGLKMPYKSTKELSARYNSEEQTIKQAGWERYHKTISRGIIIWTFQRFV